MLFRQRDHAAIEAGSITATVRAWLRPQARIGGSYRLHSRGELVVDALTHLTAEDLTDETAQDCGYPGRAELLAALEGATAGREPVAKLTWLRFHYEPRPDERSVLAYDDDLACDQFEALASGLDAMDRRSRHGPWTLQTLRLIDGHPREVASSLAATLGRETQPFKTDVRKLKRLGLTISHDRGYEVSPRGRALLDHLDWQAAGTA
jgi:hypothetical protein